MTQSPGHRFDPARAIVDLAQADLEVEAFKAELLGIFDKALGFDTAVAVRAKSGEFRYVAYNTSEKQLDLMKRSAQFATTRYAQDLLPAFERSARFGAFITSEFTRSGSAYYREVLAPAGVRSMLQICARWQGRPLLRLNFNRHGRPAFRDSSLEDAFRLLPTLEAAVAARLSTEPSVLLPELTCREAQIAQLVAQGLTTKQIGEALGTSPNTVRNQLSRLYDKLQIESRAELAAYITRIRQP